MEDNYEEQKPGLCSGALLVFLFSTLFFWKINPASALTGAWIDEAELGQMCIRQVVPSAGTLETAEKEEEQTEQKESDAESGEQANEEETKEKDDSQTGGSKGVRRSAGNHLSHPQYGILYAIYRKQLSCTVEEGTVRDVGNVLETELKKKGST